MTPAARVLLLGGLDPSGGAGITLDAAVVAIHGGEPLPIAVVLTEQNRGGFRGAHAVGEARWRAALEAVLDDGEPAAIKLGLLADAATAVAVANAVRSFAGRVPIVVDPVLGATAGGLRADGDLIAAYREHLVGLASVVTPNLPELAALFEGEPERALSSGGAVLVKGGHGEGDTADDVLLTAAGSRRYSRRRLSVGPVRGTGCALASAIAVRLARGVSLPEACRDAGDWLAARLARLGTPSAAGRPRNLPLS